MNQANEKTTEEYRQGLLSKLGWLRSSAVIEMDRRSCLEALLLVPLDLQRPILRRMRSGFVKGFLPPAGFETAEALLAYWESPEAYDFDDSGLNAAGIKAELDCWCGQTAAEVEECEALLRMDDAGLRIVMEAQRGEAEARGKAGSGQAGALQSPAPATDGEIIADELRCLRASFAHMRLDLECWEALEQVEPELRALMLRWIARNSCRAGGHVTCREGGRSFWGRVEEVA